MVHHAVFVYNPSMKFIGTPNSYFIFLKNHFQRDTTDYLVTRVPLSRPPILNSSLAGTNQIFVVDLKEESIVQ